VRLSGFGSSRRERLRRAAPLLLRRVAAMDKVPTDTRDTRQRADRERRLAEHIALATKSLREERDRLAKRLADLERQLANLAAGLDSPSAFATSRDSGRRQP